MIDSRWEREDRKSLNQKEKPLIIIKCEAESLTRDS